MGPFEMLLDPLFEGRNWIFLANDKIFLLFGKGRQEGILETCFRKN